MSTEFIWVKAKSPNRVGIWERNPAHPGKEVFVAGDNIVKVARTDLVESKLNNGDLREVAAPRQPVVEETDEEEEPPRVSAAEARRLKAEAAKAAEAGA